HSSPAIPTTIRKVAGTYGSHAGAPWKHASGRVTNGRARLHNLASASVARGPTRTIDRAPVANNTSARTRTTGMGDSQARQILTYDHPLGAVRRHRNCLTMMTVEIARAIARYHATSR